MRLSREPPAVCYPLRWPEFDYIGTPPTGAERDRSGAQRHRERWQHHQTPVDPRRRSSSMRLASKPTGPRAGDGRPMVFDNEPANKHSKTIPLTTVDHQGCNLAATPAVGTRRNHALAKIIRIGSGHACWRPSPVAAMNHALEKRESHKNVADSTFIGHALTFQKGVACRRVVYLTVGKDKYFIFNNLPRLFGYSCSIRRHRLLWP